MNEWMNDDTITGQALAETFTNTLSFNALEKPRRTPFISPFPRCRTLRIEVRWLPQGQKAKRSKSASECFNSKVLVKNGDFRAPSTLGLRVLPSTHYPTTQLYLHWLCGFGQVTSSLRTSGNWNQMGIKLAPTSCDFVRLESGYGRKALSRDISKC